MLIEIIFTSNYKMIVLLLGQLYLPILIYKQWHSLTPPFHRESKHHLAKAFAHCCEHEMNIWFKLLCFTLHGMNLKFVTFNKETSSPLIAYVT